MKRLQSRRDSSTRPLPGKRRPPASPAASTPRSARDPRACTHAHPHTRAHTRFRTEDAQAAACTEARALTTDRARVGFWALASLSAGPGTGASRRLPFAAGAAPPPGGADLGGLGCPWVTRECGPGLLDKRDIVSLPEPSPRPGPSLAHLPRVPLSCAFCFPTNLLCSHPCLFLLLGLAPFLCPRPHLPRRLPFPQPCAEPRCALKNPNSATAARRAAATPPPATFSSAGHRGSR